MFHVFERQIAGRTMRVETGKLAGQANGAVTVRVGDSVILVTAVASRKAREGIDFFPLTVDFEERLYARGKIPGSFFKREGRPTAEAILTMRLTDRPLRPLFPKGMRNDVQVIITTMSVDQENPPDILAIVGASAALTISDIPFNGPVGACRIGFIDGRLVANPEMKQMEQSQLDLVVAGTKEAIVMVEAGAKEATEEMVLQGMKLAQIINGEIIDFIEEIRRTVGKQKFTPIIVGSTSKDLEAAVADRVKAGLDSVLFHKGLKADREAGMDGLKADAIAKLADQYPAEQVAGVFESVLKKLVRARVLETGIRADGRTLTEIRPITCEVGVLPRTHGSGLFTRGETQVLTITTLGSPGEKQKLDGLGIEDFKRYMHHYNFPPYSTGEVKRMGGAGRREIGHGALAERALLAVIPSEETFPYTLRVVSEVVSSNGSTSMASVCASTLSLMDAGVPIKSPVAGVAMGLVKGEGDSYAVLTDIQGMEDFLGDMDFKVAGTADGITALQMDMKTTGITFPIIAEAVAQAKVGRMFILGKMKETITAARPEMSKYAPRMTRITINPEKIGAVIGPGGKMIRSIIEQTGASVDIEDDGTVYIGAASEDSVKRAIGIITGLTKDIEVGEIYTGKVVRLMNFGAFVEILPGKDGLVHVSELSSERVNRVEDVVNIGDEITVMVTEIDRMGRVNLSRKAVLEGLGQGGAHVREEGSQGGPPQGGRPPFERSGGDRGGPPRRDGGRPPFRSGPPR
ncbi:MAG: polyribonucleotide nucleotidyltransferase [Dehalococcoidia bacterium]|nr:polyribonucleotide nucleotidyltransferase [Dehalococcoidia bacterium]